MFNIPYKQNLRNARLKAQLTQAQAAAKIGMSRQRWSHLEVGSRRPSQEERRAINQLLGVYQGFIPPPSVLRKLADSGRRAFPEGPVHFPPQDRPTHVRYFAALRRHQRLTLELSNRIRQRPDFEVCEFFCHAIALESYLEALYVLRLIAEGAKPALVSPAQLGRTPHSIVEPRSRDCIDHHRLLCLVDNGVFRFFQVSFSTPQVYRVDCLLWDRGWSVLEIDGGGHDSSQDIGRSQALGMKVERLSCQEILEWGESVAA